MEKETGKKTDKIGRADRKEEKEKKDKKKKWLLLLLLLFFCIIIVLLVFLLKKPKEEPKPESQEVFADRDAELGILPGMTTAEIQDRLNEVVAEGMMNISINPTPVFKDGSSKGDLRIENIKANHYSYIVSITLDDTGEEIYKSGLLSPGYFIEKAALSKNLSKGKYEATARFKAYQKGNNKEPIGAAAAKVLITVQN